MKPQIYILKNTHLEVHISTLGATLTRMLTKDLQGKVVDVLLGMEKAEDYESPEYIASGAYLGAIIGRYGNRIARGRFEIDGVKYRERGTSRYRFADVDLLQSRRRRSLSGNTTGESRVFAAGESFTNRL